jgi:CO dehydrogenase/acetyl-CoA synthase gamma subunit (corrinoid Fe-S protein)
MVVEQEMAEIYPPEPEDLSEFLPEIDCGDCGFSSCVEFAEALILKTADVNKCPHLDDEVVRLLNAALSFNKDPIPYNVMMEQVPCQLIEINSPDETAPLLITCNFEVTVALMKSILEETSTKAFLLPTYTHGYSVDNAVHERMFKAIEVWKAMQENNVSDKIGRSQLIVPGLAESEKNAIRQLTRWDVLEGPVSGFLTPLFLNHIGR